MKILAVDTTATCASVAICDGGKVLASYTQKNGLTHSETLLPMIEAMLKNLKLTPDDVDMFAVSEGPGSFTGVRIGVAAVKGLAFGKNKICVGTSTLDALARNAAGLPGNFLAVPAPRAEKITERIDDRLNRYIFQFFADCTQEELENLEQASRLVCRVLDSRNEDDEF